MISFYKMIQLIESNDIIDPRDETGGKSVLNITDLGTTKGRKVSGKLPRGMNVVNRKSVFNKDFQEMIIKKTPDSIHLYDVDLKKFNIEVKTRFSSYNKEYPTFEFLFKDYLPAMKHSEILESKEIQKICLNVLEFIYDFIKSKDSVNFNKIRTVFNFMYDSTWIEFDSLLLTEIPNILIKLAFVPLNVPDYSHNDDDFTCIMYFKRLEYQEVDWRPNETVPEDYYAL